MRAASYFAGWALAIPGLLFAGAILALHHAIAVANLLRILWEILVAFAYGLPLLALVAIALCIAGFFRMGRIIGGSMLLVSSLAAIAVILEGVGAPKGLSEALYFAPTAGAALLAGWLVHAETRDNRPPPG
jgi:hypothetical protein